MWNTIKPYDIEELVTLYHQNGLIDAKIGVTGETFYELIEPIIAQNWSNLSDEFRWAYRREIYKE